MWPMPGHDDPVPKLSYVKLFEPWGWIVGTGIYLDDVDQAVHSKEAEINSAISQRNGLIGTILTCCCMLTAAGVAFISKRITRPIVTASEMLKDIARAKAT
jgi:methyl-accepting chemotaxis protein